MPQFIYSPWAKFCGKGQDAAAKQVCFTGKDAVWPSRSAAASTGDAPLSLNPP
jgi:hypothetical protein